MVKIEGDSWLAESIHKLTQNGVPVCAHIGLTPQSVNVFGGFKVQGKTEEQAKNLINTAKHLEETGAAMLLIECVPSVVATQINQSVSIPVIGMGAGADTDAQVLVLPTVKIHPLKTETHSIFSANTVNYLSIEFHNYTLITFRCLRITRKHMFCIILL